LTSYFISGIAEIKKKERDCVNVRVQSITKEVITSFEKKFKKEIIK